MTDDDESPFGLNFDFPDLESVVSSTMGGNSDLEADTDAKTSSNPVASGDVSSDNSSSGDSNSSDVTADIIIGDGDNSTVDTSTDTTQQILVHLNSIDENLTFIAKGFIPLAVSCIAVYMFLKWFFKRFFDRVLWCFKAIALNK